MSRDPENNSMKKKTQKTQAQRPVRVVGSGRLVSRFGSVVREMRQTRMMSGPVFAQIAGIGKGHLSKIENHGENVSLETIEKLACAFGVEPEDLISACNG